MYITPTVSMEDLRHIANTPTQEAAEQAKLYGITDLASRLGLDLRTSNEFGCFREDATAIPTAVFGVRHQATHDMLFLMITTACQQDYRGFATEARKWLSKRLRPVRCILPTQSKQTLRMTLKWGFTAIPSLKHYDFDCQTMEYTPQGISKA